MVIPMKIVFHINSLGRGGAERVVSILSQYFAENNHEVIVTTLWEEEEEYDLFPKVERRDVGLSEQEEQVGRVTKIILRHKKLRNCIKEIAPDVVIAFCVKANYRSVISMLGMSIPLIVSVRNDPKIDYVGTGSRLMNWLMERKVAACVFQTEEAKTFFSEKLQKKSQVIYNPIQPQYLEELPVENRSRSIVTVGRLAKQKNQLLLIKAMKEVHGHHPDYDLKIYGGDTQDGTREILVSYIKEEKMETYVTLMGMKEDIKKEIKEAAMFVLPSDYEGMPNALIEAMAMGIPCIATDCPCGGPATLIEQGVSGILVPLGNQTLLSKSMIQLIENQEMADQIAENGMMIINRVNPTRVCKTWDRLVNNV